MTVMTAVKLSTWNRVAGRFQEMKISRTKCIGSNSAHLQNSQFLPLQVGHEIPFTTFWPPQVSHGAIFVLVKVKLRYGR